MVYGQVASQKKKKKKKQEKRNVTRQTFEEGAKPRLKTLAVHVLKAVHCELTNS